jgi:hypothetical protein
VERGIFRRFAAALLPAVVADAQMRLEVFKHVLISAAGCNSG